MSHTTDTTDDGDSTEGLNAREKALEIKDTAHTLEMVLSQLHDKEVPLHLDAWRYEPTDPESKAAKRTGMIGSLFHESGAEIALYGQGGDGFGLEMYRSDGTMLGGQDMVPVAHFESVIQPIVQMIHRVEQPR